MLLLQVLREMLHMHWKLWSCHAGVALGTGARPPSGMLCTVWLALRNQAVQVIDFLYTHPLFKMLLHNRITPKVTLFC